MNVRSSEDKGEIDGYFGMFDEVQASPAAFKKVATPKGKLTTMTVGPDPNGFGFQWTCVACKATYRTNLFDRPDHICD